MILEPGLGKHGWRETFRDFVNPMTAGLVPLRAILGVVIPFLIYRQS
jgi:hypothetical protein